MPLAEQSVALDKHQFEELFKSNFGTLCQYARQFVPDHNTAQDVVQKVFIALWEHRANIDPNKSIMAYLYRSVRNRSLNHIRDEKKYRSAYLDIECANFAVPMEQDSFELDALKQRIEKALAALPEKCREVFEKSRFEEMKYREIAEEMNISVKTVEVHMSKALRIMREMLTMIFWFFFYVK